jgi:hypothetical protein
MDRNLLSVLLHHNQQTTNPSVNFSAATVAAASPLLSHAVPAKDPNEPEEDDDDNDKDGNANPSGTAGR